MTQSSRRLSGSKPHDAPLRKSEVEERERARAAKEEAANRTPQQRATFDRQIRELAELTASGASTKTMADAKKRWEQEREADELNRATGSN